MHPDPQRIDLIFLEAAEKATDAERAAYLDVACAGDPELRQRVERLLAAQSKVGHFLEAPAPALIGTVEEPPVTERPGTLVGPYKLLEQIGEGGMGTVWMAEQTEPIQRRVAVKVVKEGMDSRQVLARFEAERQALALMEHPNIARVLDAGKTPSGRPYFVMELVKGQPITRYCDDKRLGVRERLALFGDVCRAVQHAHQKGVIHRDLKPSNVLVAPYDGKPVVKVIDFGVAKATGQRLTDKTLFTGFGALVGTPEYMSPEQAEVNNQDIDTRSDIYALGVLLYELLTGSTPLTRQRVQEAALLEVLRLIREEEPPRPSTRLSESAEALPSISAQRQTEPEKLRRLVRGELDWMVMKALEKDRNRRYETANGFAMDVQRYLADEPVAAGPPAAGYRLRKFVHRNKRPVLAVSLVFVALVAGITVSIWQAVRATQAEADTRAALAEKEEARAAEAEQRLQARANEQKALSEAALATAVKEFLQNDLLQLAAARQQSREKASGVKMDPDLKVRELVLRAAQKIEGKFKDQPLVEAEIRSTLGWTLQEIGRADLALPQLLRVRELYTAHRGPDHPDTLHSMNSLASTFAALGRHPEAFKLREETLALRKAKLGPDHPDTLHSMNNLANSYFALGRHPEALELRKATLTLRKDKLGPDHPDTLHSMNNLANSYFLADRTKEALDLYEKALHLRKTTLGPDHPDTLHSMNNLANAYVVRGRTQDALELRKETVRLLKAKLGPDHPDTLASMSNLASSYADAGRLQEALKLDDESFQLQKAKLGPDHHDTLLSMSNLALSYKALGRLDEALKLYEEALARWKAKSGPNHPDTIMSMYNLGVLRRQASNYAGAEELLLGCQAAVAAGQSGIHPHVRANVARELTRLYDAWGKRAEADKWLRRMPAGKQIEYGFERHYIWPLLWGWPRW